MRHWGGLRESEREASRRGDEDKVKLGSGWERGNRQPFSDERNPILSMINMCLCRPSRDGVPAPHVCAWCDCATVDTTLMKICSSTHDTSSSILAAGEETGSGGVG